MEKELQKLLTRICGKEVKLDFRLVEFIEAQMGEAHKKGYLQAGIDKFTEAIVTV